MSKDLEAGSWSNTRLTVNTEVDNVAQVGGALIEAFAGFNTKGGFVQWRVKALEQPIMIFDEKHNIYVEVAD